MSLVLMLIIHHVMQQISVQPVRPVVGPHVKTGPKIVRAVRYLQDNSISMRNKHMMHQTSALATQ
jgi:hypothetical protein